MKRIDPKWDRILGDRWFLTSAILAIVFTGIASLALRASKITFRVNERRFVFSSEAAPLIFWLSVGTLSGIALTFAVAAVYRFRARTRGARSA